MKVKSFRSKRPSRKKVYHNNSKCTEGNNIEKSNKIHKVGGACLCEHCKRLNRNRR